MALALLVIDENHLGLRLMKKVLKITLAVLVTAFAFSANADPIEWGGNGHSYDVITDPEDRSITWDEARDMAEDLGGHLATITSWAENQFVSWLVDTYGEGNLERYWLGGYQTNPGAPECEPNDCWAWVSGETWWDGNGSAWWLGEPNNGASGTQHYLHYWPYPGWFDDMENRPVMDSFVVEYSVPEPGTLALLALGLLSLAFTRRQQLRRQEI